MEEFVCKMYGFNCASVNKVRSKMFKKRLKQDKRPPDLSLWPPCAPSQKCCSGFCICQFQEFSCLFCALSYTCSSVFFVFANFSTAHVCFVFCHVQFFVFFNFSNVHVFCVPSCSAFCIFQFY